MVLGKIKELKNIELIGVMTILPQETQKKERKKYYNKIKKIEKEIQKKHFSLCAHTSMGMSGDMRQAVLEGANMVRIGTAIFGQRES
mgnify:CR=1 FL=1